MTLVDFYKVIERKVKSIKLVKLENINISGDGFQGKCIPSDTEEPDKQVDGKLFRIGYKWSNDTICRIADHAVVYWNGKPKDFNHLD